MTEQIPEPWEIWHMKFRFSERKGYKYRPAIVYETRQEKIALIMVTSADSKRSFPNDYVIADWAPSGLDKPSIARIDKRLIVGASAIGTARRIGELSFRDKTEIAKRIRNIMA